MSDPTQFEAFMAAYEEMVFRTALSLLSNTAEAEDVTQDVFLRFWSHYPKRVGSTTVGGWLKAVTRNLCLNHLHRYRARWKTFTDLTADNENGENCSVEFAAPDTVEPARLTADRQDLIEQALTRLPADQRAAMVLYYFEDMDCAEIARQLGVSLCKVKTDNFRARAKMRERLHLVREHVGI